jgi:2-methylcitrate dehydratase PrpD
MGKHKVQDASRIEITRLLAEFAAGINFENLPEEVRKRSRLFVLDGISVMLAAVDFATRDDDHCLKHYLDAAAPPGPATIVGMKRKTTPMMASFANGLLSEVLDYQDSNLAAKLHPGTANIPATLSVSETSACSGRELLAAVVAGYEVACRLGMATQPAHWYSGFQATGTYNTCGAAAAAGRLLGFGIEDMVAALSIAGFVLPISNGDNIFKGHSAKPIHGGQSATSGVSAAYLAHAGYRAGPLEGEAPRYHAPLCILGTDDPNLEEAVRGIGTIWHSLEVGFKPFPVGHLNIGPVEICLHLMAERPIEISRIESVEVRSFHDAWKFTGQKYTSIESNYVDSQLSLPFTVAATLIDGEMTPRQLARTRLIDPALHDLASRVTVVPVDEMSQLFPHEWPVEVEIRLKDGEVRKKRIDQVMWSPRRPPTWEAVAGKFLSSATPVIGEERALRAIEFVAGIDDKPSVAPLLDLVAG